MSGSGVRWTVRIAVRWRPQETKDYHKWWKQWIYGNLHHQENAKKLWLKFNSGMRKVYSALSCDLEHIFFSKTTRASSNAKVKSSLTFWCICNFQHFYRSNLRPPINLNFFEIWNFTPPINFYLKVNYLILGWDLKKGLGQLFYYHNLYISSWTP